MILPGWMVFMPFFSITNCKALPPPDPAVAVILDALGVNLLMAVGEVIEENPTPSLMLLDEEAITVGF